MRYSPYDACFYWMGPELTFYACLGVKSPIRAWVVKGTKGVWKGFSASGDMRMILHKLNVKWFDMGDMEEEKATKHLKNGDKIDTICEKIQRKYCRLQEAFNKRNKIRAVLEKDICAARFEKMKKRDAQRIFKKVL